MPTTKLIAAVIRFLGLGLIIVGLVSCRMYKPHWTPPENFGHYENLDTTGLERGILLSGLGASLFFIGVYVSQRKEPVGSASATYRRRGIVLMFSSIPLHFVPFVGLGLPCLLVGGALFLYGIFGNRKATEVPQL